MGLQYNQMIQRVEWFDLKDNDFVLRYFSILCSVLSQLSLGLNASLTYFLKENENIFAKWETEFEIMSHNTGIGQCLAL